MADFAVTLGIVVVSGLYTSLWGAFKDCPFEGYKPATFPRSVYFHVAIFLPLYFVPRFAAPFRQLELAQIFFLVMGVERFLAEIYKGFFRTEDQAKYFVPSRITFFGRPITSDALRYAAGVPIIAVVFAVGLLQSPVVSPLGFLATGYLGGLVVALGGAYKDAPFEGFKVLKFQRSALVLALLSPLFYFLNDRAHPVPLGFLIYMNGGLERFVVEYYKTYIQRTMSGKFRPDLPRIAAWSDRREPFHYAALTIIAGLAVLYVYEVTAGIALP
ncbi:MAG: hypothetical protein AB1505_13200 [Candidatus Latescibacterota bacterium]